MMRVYRRKEEQREKAVHACVRASIQDRLISDTLFVLLFLTISCAHMQSGQHSLAIGGGVGGELLTHLSCKKKKKKNVG